MENKITVRIEPLTYYNRYASSNQILCALDFDIFCDGNDHHFHCESSNICVKELLSQIEDYLSGNLSPGAELYYIVPWIAGGQCVYPYSFQIASPDIWSFRYKRNQNDTEFDFVCDIRKDDLISMRDQIKEQFSNMDWDSLGKTPLYTFDLPDKDFVWSYSARALCKTLNQLCVGKSIQNIFVSAVNYADPLYVEENFVNYYNGAKVLIRLENVLLDLLIYAEGLMKWRIFTNGEYMVNGPTVKLIENGEEEFCDIGNVYHCFKADYTNSDIKEVSVKKTDYWPWLPRGFDKEKAKNSAGLPQMITFRLSNDHDLSLYGLDDDFVIKLLQAPK